jgi:hypothetical protein
MLNAIYLILASAALIVIGWQYGFSFGIAGAPAMPDATITFSAFIAALIFFGLWLAGKVHKREAKSNLIYD